MPVTIQDIADKLKLSNSTVSRVLNNKGHEFISDATRQRVLTAVREMGYRPNPAARALVQKRTDTIALWIPRPHASYYAQLVYQVTTAMNNSGLDVITKEVGLKDDVEIGHIERFFRFPVDGILACDADSSVARYQQTFPDTETPIVGMGCYYLPSHDYVAIDNSATAREAVLHLRDVGCRRIAHLLAFSSNHVGEWRRDAYQQVMDEQRIPCELIVCSEMSRLSARTSLTAYLHTHGCPDGLFCHNDDMAIGAYRALCDLGYHVPRDVALIGCDGIIEIEYLETPLSTIVQPTEEMCRLACLYLKQRIDNATLPPQQCTLASHLALRASTRR